MERSRALVVIAIAATLAVAAAVVVWIQSQDDTNEATPSDPTSSASSSPSSSSSTPPSDVVIGGTPGPGFVTAAPELDGDPVDVEHFSSPTGNIGCLLTAEQVLCEIVEHDFDLPPEPEDCEYGWFAGFEVTADQSDVPTAGACLSDTVIGADDQLAYGTASVVADFACLSQESGMTCWNQQTGHGFTVSRAAYVLF